MNRGQNKRHSTACLGWMRMKVFCLVMSCAGSAGPRPSRTCPRPSCAVAFRSHTPPDGSHLLNCFRLFLLHLPLLFTAEPTAPLASCSCCTARESTPPTMYKQLWVVNASVTNSKNEKENGNWEEHGAENYTVYINNKDYLEFCCLN